MAVTGPNAIETSFVRDWADRIALLSQQKMSKLQSTVMVESGLVGEDASPLEQVGVVEAQILAERHAPTPIVPTPFDRRWVQPTDMVIADLIDTADRLRQKLDFTSNYSMAQAASLARNTDSIIIEGMFGTNFTGKDGTTSVPLPSSQEIDSSTAQLSIDDLREARFLMENADVDFEMDEAYAVITPQQKKDLLETTEITSSDYATIKALVGGEIDTFMGFKFITSTRLPGAPKYWQDGSLTAAANTNWGGFYVKSGLSLGVWEDMVARVDTRVDLNMSQQVYARQTKGATRNEEVKVVKVITKTP